jgi:hypothetical protein
LGRHGEHFYFYVVHLREIIAMNSSGIKTASSPPVGSLR